MSKFTPPTESEVRELCKQRGYPDYTEEFIAHHATRGWVPKGYTKQMTSWESALTTWHKYAPAFSPGHGAPQRPELQPYEPPTQSGTLPSPIPEEPMTEAQERAAAEFHDIIKPDA